MSQQFGTFTASELYCPKCGSSQPVREKLLLVLPSGELHEFLCSRCATSVGQRTVTGPAVAARPRPGAEKRPPPKRLPRELVDWPRGPGGLGGVNIRIRTGEERSLRE